MKQIFYLIIIIVAGMPEKAFSQDASTFPKGEKAANVHHTGNVWLNELVKADNILDCHVSLATFDANARLDWHSHPGGQILLVTEGTGYYQEKDKPKQVVHKGSVIKCLPNIEHWHGATPQSGFAYIAVNANNDKGKTVWGQKVTDEQYSSESPAAKSTASQEQEIIKLSKQKWTWMAEKRADTLAALFHEKAMFVHMGGSWGKARELEVIKSGGIHYKKAEIYSVNVNIIGNTAILLNDIDLLAVVGGNEVINPFMVTEVYIHDGEQWSMGSLTFSRLMRPVKMTNNTK
jgi:quercetin dioxygenase-like cupin family protein